MTVSNFSCYTVFVMRHVFTILVIGVGFPTRAGNIAGAPSKGSNNNVSFCNTEKKWNCIIHSDLNNLFERAISKNL